jgi:hypothetical protein
MSCVLVLLVAIDVFVVLVDLSFGCAPALLLYPRGRGYK